jgi:hypothetical protein
MNFPPIVKSWLILISIVVSTGSAAGYTAFLSGASPAGATIVGIGMAFSNVLHSLLASPKELAAKMEKSGQTNPPIAR